MTKRFMVAGAFAATILLIAPIRGNAQTREERDDFVVDHYGPTDQVYTFINPGVLGNAEEGETSSFACANIYVYWHQNPVACGSCFVSANGSIEVDLNNDLRKNPVTGVFPDRGVIKVVYTQASANNGCDARNISVTASQALKSFRTKGSSEIELDEAYLSAAESRELTDNCGAIFDVLSGNFNITCGSADPPPAPRRK